MATQSIQIKDFTGGRNFVTSAFNLYPSEAPVFSNISLDGTGMRTRNFVPDKVMLPPNGVNEIQVAPKLGEAYDLDFSNSSYTEKVRFYQGERYIISGGVPYKLGDANEKFSTVVDNPLTATCPQATYTPTGERDSDFFVNQYTYFISYRSAAGFESPLEEINTVNGLLQWDTAFTTETPSEQTIVVAAPPLEGDFGRIYRMGDNISYPSLCFQFDFEWTVDLNKGIVNSADGTFTFALSDDDLGNFATTWGAVYPDALRYLASTKYGLAASRGSQLYLSMNQPDAWSELNMLNFGSEITGIASVYRGFLVFTEGSYVYLVTGSSLAKLDVSLLSTDMGCTSNSSLAEVGQHALIWTYNRRFYMFNGSSIQELEPNTYDWDYFIRKGYDEDVTGISMYNKYMIGSDKGICMIDLDHSYRPFIDYDLETKFIHELPTFMREVIVEEQKTPGVYADDSSFYSLKVHTYGDVTYEDENPETDNFAMGCYGGLDTCVEDLTTCLEMGCYGGLGTCTAQPEECTDAGQIGLYPYLDLGDAPIPVLHRSEYYSPLFTFGDMNAQCTFSSVEVLFEGELVVFAYIDAREIVFKDNYIASSPRTARLILPNAQARGNFLQVRLRFNGVVHGYRVNGEPLQQLSK